MSNAKFRSDYAKILNRAGDKAEAVVRQSAIALQSSMVEKSPVDTGRFKGNWQAGLGATNTSTSAGNDASGNGAITRTLALMQAWKAGQTIYLTNNLPYARRLEYGYSKKAPGGMVRITVAEFRSKIASIAAGIQV